MPSAIKVENLGKSYLVGHNNARAESYTALRDVLTRNGRNLARKTRDRLTGRQIVRGDEVEDCRALKDVTTKSSLGYRVGIIGRNGAGKSSRLKILSLITEPSTPRIANFLEVDHRLSPRVRRLLNIRLSGAKLFQSNWRLYYSDNLSFIDTRVSRP